MKKCDNRVSIFMLLIFPFSIMTGFAYATPDTSDCPRQVRVKPDPFIRNGGDFDKCDGRIVGPQTVCTGYRALYNVTASEVRNSCAEVTWSFPRISGTISKNSWCDLSPERYPFKAYITPEEGCPGQIKVKASAKSSCTKDCGTAALQVEIVKPEAVDTMDEKIDKLGDLVNQIRGRQAIRSYTQSLKNELTNEYSVDDSYIRPLTNAMYFAAQEQNSAKQAAQRELTRVNIQSITDNLKESIEDTFEAEAEFATGRQKKAVKDLMESAENLIASAQTVAFVQNPCTSFKLFDKLRQVLGSGDIGKFQDYIERLENDGEN